MSTNTQEQHLKFMEIATQKAEENAVEGFKAGGPFGAVIVQKGKIIGKGRNQVLENHDPTAHAEVQAIREACLYLGTHDLSGSVIYTSCYPCPMCMAAVMWANIKKIFYGNTQKDAAKIGFRDDNFYIVLENIIQGKADTNEDILKLVQLGQEITIDTFKKFQKQSGALY
ncbi:MAG: nucleoside deaminase [Defluviitaleaceae bacterium]|nr:nucleoside deaminase [Defluviitaleaceae bacterium]